MSGGNRHRAGQGDQGGTDNSRSDNDQVRLGLLSFFPEICPEHQTDDQGGNGND